MAWHDQPKFRTHPGVEEFIAHLDEPHRQRVSEIRKLIKNLGDDVVECLAWKVPAFFRENDGGMSPLGYLSPAKNHLTVGLFRGVEIDDASGLLVGTGKSPIRKLTAKNNDDLPMDAICQWFSDAYDLEFDD